MCNKILNIAFYNESEGNEHLALICMNELHPLTPLALKAGPREPHLGLSIGGQALHLGGNQ